MKKLPFVFLFAVSALPAFGRGEEVLTATVNGIEWTYSISNGEATVGGGGGDDFGWNSSSGAIPTSTRGAVTIPSELPDEYGDWDYTVPVTSIGDVAFSGCSGVTAFTIPAGVSHIRERAFSGCSGLTTIIFEEDDDWYDGNKCEIEDEAFYGCSKLTSITIPNRFTTVGENVFYGCSRLTTVGISSAALPVNSSWSSSPALLDWPANVTTCVLSCNLVYNGFGGAAGGDIGFPRTDSIRTIRLTGNDIDQFSFSSFGNCSALNSIEVDPNCSTDFESINGVLFRNDGRRKELVAFPRGRSGSYAVPNGVTSIGDSAFYNCSQLASVTNPDGVTSIGASAFSGCSGLTSISIPSGVTSIGNSAFSGCSGLRSVAVPDGFTIQNLFPSFRTIERASVSPGSWRISSGMFANCSGLTSITIPASVSCIESGAFDGCSSLAEVHISDLSAWCSVLFYAGSDNPLYYAHHLFLGDEEVTELVIPDDVTTINAYAFSGCSGLMSVVIQDSVTTIGKYAFSGCSALKSIVVPDSVTTIGVNAFESCSGLTSVQLGTGIRNLGAKSFYNCSALASVTLSDGIRSIADDAFEGCSKWAETRINVSDLSSWTVNTINSKLNGARRLFVNGTELTEVVIPDGVTSIGDYAFCGCSQLSSITIPSSVTSLGTGSFSGCSGLTSIAIPRSVTSLGTGAFSGCSGLTSITIPDSATSIGSYAFSDCSGLSSIAIPGSVSTIGDHAFDNCSGLTAITISNGVKWIGQYAFFNCKSVAEPVVVPSSVEVVRPYAFSFYRDYDLPVYGTVFAVFLPRQYEEIGNTFYRVGVIPYDSQSTLQVESEFGSPVPETGVRTREDAEYVHAFIEEPEPADGVRHVCTGWTGTGSVPSSYENLYETYVEYGLPISFSSTNISFRVLENSTLTWNWRTDYQISVSVVGSGDCDFGTQWVEEGTTTTAAIVPTPQHYEISLAGDTDGVTQDGTTLIIPSDGPREIVVMVEEVRPSLVVETAHGTATPIPGTTKWGWGDTVLASVEADAPADGVRYVCTGWTGTGSVPECGTETSVTFEIEEDSSIAWLWETNVWLELAVSGSATADFSSGWSSLGETIGVNLMPDSEWFSVSLSGDTNGVVVERTVLTIPCDRPRTLGVMVVDSVVMDNVQIPFSWLAQNAAAALAAAGGDYGAAAMAKAANGVNQVWECYVAGLDPMNATNQFLAEILFDENGLPSVEWTPDLGSARDYVVEGKESLSDGWGPTNVNSRFFRVKVQMPE